MIRCVIELLPQGNESRARTIGLIEIANIGGTAEWGEYAVIPKKTPPFSGALKDAWRRGRMALNEEETAFTRPREGEDEAMIVARVSGHHRTRRGSYDLLYKALVACGLDKR